MSDQPEWEIYAKRDDMPLWTARDFDPRYKGDTVMLAKHFLGRILLVPGLIAAVTDRVFIYRVRNVHTGERKNVYSRLSCDSGTRLSPGDWLGEMDDRAFN